MIGGMPRCIPKLIIALLPQIGVTFPLSLAKDDIRSAWKEGCLSFVFHDFAKESVPGFTRQSSRDAR